MMAAADSLGMGHNALRMWWRDYRAKGPPEPLPDVPIPPPVIVKPTYRVSQDRHDGKGRTRVVAIGDAHDGPAIAKDRFRWFGQFVAERRPDVVIQIGDMFSLDSLCRYDGNETLKGKSKPSLKMDLASGKQALEAFKEGLDGYEVERHCTLGNHEDRVESFTNRTPEVAELLTDNLHTILTDGGWSYSPFGVLHFVGGVAFTHSPLTTMGKPYGGMYAENQIARDSLHDLVFGHTHKGLHKTFPKLGHRHLTIINTGCALPDGHIEAYARHSLTGWTFGIWELEIERGGIQGARWVTMRELEERYGCA